MSDLERISPYSINTISSIEVMRMKKNIDQAIISLYKNKLSKLTS